MTKEELKVLKDWMPELELMARYNDNSIDYQRYSALDMAIKALEQEPCEDCVKREDVKSRMIKYGFLAPDMTVTEFVEDLPSVTPKPKMGHWIDADKLLTEITKTKEEYNKYVNADSYFKDGYISALNWFEKLIHEQEESED